MYNLVKAHLEIYITFSQAITSTVAQVYLKKTRFQVTQRFIDQVSRMPFFFGISAHEYCLIAERNDSNANAKHFQIDSKIVLRGKLICEAFYPSDTVSAGNT
ncbi:hypothetical protein F6R98_05630 [Candidatus Methylospira mobilis]|uniref:Uncharacterized protein n=1 Tax=Candidatus Methylospira mobilis TaxID=1808979 RepID=A0A5Q0BJ53_9GAMM|nr:hypothetical protein [Candidatus Methylospira mobilis]QFY42178.1 hypothetical protein F6R98_05630 [Candidatus Methylospira mobilis]WNV03193.1 hypothetical protein RP726_12005 [Candidatus Methylospira mobilis]